MKIPSPDTIKPAAAAFVDLLKRQNADQWKALPTLVEEDKPVIAQLLTVTGFEVGEIRHGWLKGHYRDQGGESTGEKYGLNSHWPVHLTHPSQGNYEHATHWLDRAVGETLKLLGTNDEKVVIGYLVEAITMKRPLEHILFEYPEPRVGEYMFHWITPDSAPARDHDKLPKCNPCYPREVGRHGFCQMPLVRIQVSETHYALTCKGDGGCNFRTLIPLAVSTYGDLRRYMHDGTVPVHTAETVTAAATTPV